MANAYLPTPQLLPARATHSLSSSSDAHPLSSHAEYDDDQSVGAYSPPGGNAGMMPTGPFIDLTPPPALSDIGADSGNVDSSTRIRIQMNQLASPPFFVSMEDPDGPCDGSTSTNLPGASRRLLPPRRLTRSSIGGGDDVLIPLKQPAADSHLGTTTTGFRASLGLHPVMSVSTAMSTTSTGVEQPSASWRLPQATLAHQGEAAAAMGALSAASPGGGGFGHFFSFNGVRSSPQPLTSMRQRYVSFAASARSAASSAEASTLLGLGCGDVDGSTHHLRYDAVGFHMPPSLQLHSTTPGSLVATPASLAGSCAALRGADVGEVVPGVIYIASYRTFCNAETCATLDIQAYLSVAAEVKPGLPPHVNVADVEAGRIGFLKLDMRDNASTTLQEHLATVFRFVDEQTQLGRPVALYCQAGKSRSAALAVALMMREYCMPADRALALLKKRYAAADPNVFFIDQLDRVCVVGLDNDESPLMTAELGQ